MKGKENDSPSTRQERRAKRQSNARKMAVHGRGLKRQTMKRARKD
jgi:hypothetical protein